MPSATSCATEWSLVDRNGVPFRLPRTMIFLGREECDIALKSRSVDKRHAVVTYDHYQNKFKLKDLSSINGTFVNDSRIPEQVYITLENTDTIRFGYDPMVYRMERIEGEEQTDSGLPTPDRLHAWNNSKSEQIGECKGCITEQKIRHSRGSNEDVHETVAALHTCEDNQNVESGYDTWPGRNKASRDNGQSTLKTDLIEGKCTVSSPISVHEEHLLQRKLRDAEVFGGEIFSQVSNSGEIDISPGAAQSRIKWWEEKRLQESNMADPPVKQDRKDIPGRAVASPERPSDLDLTRNNNEESYTSSKCTYMEISHLTDDSHLVPSSEQTLKHLNGSSSSEPPGTAFTVNLGDDAEETTGSPKIDMTANLSNFLPSKIRRSFRERAATRKEKDTKEDASPTRQKKIDDIWNTSAPGGQRGKLKHQSSGGYVSDGHNVSDPDEDLSIRSDGPPSRSKRISETKKLRSSSLREQKARAEPATIQTVTDTSSYLIEKMFQNSSRSMHKSPKTSQPPEYGLYKEAQSFDASPAVLGQTVPALKQSEYEPDLASRLYNKGDPSPTVSPAGTYTIDDEPEEVTLARQSVEKSLSESMQSSSTVTGALDDTAGDEYADSLDNENDHCDINDLERKRAQSDVIGSMDVEVGSAVDQQTDILNISESAPKWVSQWASLASKSGKDAASPTEESPRSLSNRNKARPGTGRKLPNPPVKQNSQSDVSSSFGSESSGPNSPQNPSKSQDSVFSRLAEPRNRNKNATTTDRSQPVSSAFNRKNSFRSSSGGDKNSKSEKWKANNPDTGTASKWRRYKPESDKQTVNGGGDTARSVASVDTDVLLQDTAKVMAVMEARVSSKRLRETTFTKTKSPNVLEIHEGNSDTDSASRVAASCKLKKNTVNTRKSFPVSKTDSTNRLTAARLARQASDAVSDVFSESEAAMDNVSVSSESSVAMSEDSARFKRQGSKGKGTMSMTRPNRAFSLRRARLESEEEAKGPSSGAKSSQGTKDNRSRSNSYSSCSEKSVSSSGRTEVSLGARIVKKSQENVKSSFSRSDGGRHSLRVTRTPMTKQSTKPATPKSANLTRTNSRSGNSSQPGSRSSSPKSQEWNAWERRKGYDPRRAVAEAKAKSRKPSTDSKEKDSTSRQLYRSGEQVDLNSSLPRDAVSSSEDLGSSHSVEIAKVSIALARDMENLSRDESQRGSSGLNHSSTEELVRNIFNNNNSSRSAFSAPKFTRSRSPSPLKSPPDPAAPRQRFMQAQNARLENGVIRRKEWDKSESYDALIVSSIFQLSNKLKHSTDKIIGKLRESHHVSKTPSPIDELLNLPTNSEIPGWKSANQELAGVLRHLRKVEHHLQVIDKVVLGASDSSSVISNSSSSTGFDQSQNLEHITKIRNEKVAFRPIDNPSGFKPWNASEFSSKDYY